MPKPKKVSKRKIQKLRSTMGYMMFVIESDKKEDFFSKYFGFKIYYNDNVEKNTTELAVYYTRS